MIKELLITAQTLLLENWGHTGFRPQQAEVIEHALNGEDTVAVLPTGYGKSACFQIPAMMMEGTALVLSPLIALMKDQCDDAQERGIAATYLNSHVEDDVAEDRLHNLQRGKYDLFYIAPERLRSKAFRAAIRNTEVSYLVVDEAHCASQWGHDFRPAYMRIHELLDIFDETGFRPPILAVTATATADIVTDIVKAVGIDADDYKTVVADPIRPNLEYEVWRGNEWRNLDDAIDRCRPNEGRYIFYSATRKGAELIKKNIDERLWPGLCGVYHAGLSKSVREQMQDDFKNGTTPIIAATCAFGMGIDVPNIRGVVHFGIPMALEDYVQEAGRAGRDGAHAHVTCIHSEYVEGLRFKMLDSSNPSYDCFVIVWKWLHDNVAEGDILLQTAQSISLAIKATMGVDISSGAVGGVLSTMEAYGLVARGYAPAGLVVDADLPALKCIVEEGSELVSTNVYRTLRALWESCILPTFPPGAKLEGRMEIAVDRPQLADVAGFAEGTVVKHIKDSPCCKVGKAFSGKTTSIIEYGATLEDVLPKDTIVAKRARALARLQRMIEYTSTKDRKGMIRSYFLHGTGVAQV